MKMDTALYKKIRRHLEINQMSEKLKEGQE